MECVDGASLTKSRVSPLPYTDKQVGYVLERLQHKEGFLSKDGKYVLEKEKERNIFTDPSQGNRMMTAKTDEVATNHLGKCLQLMEFIKAEVPPSGVVFGKGMVTIEAGKYEEDKQYLKLHDVIGTGVHGDICVIKDKITQEEMAQKTIMIAHFRPEEVRAWVDLSGDGHFPALYSFQIVGNKVVINMEKIENAITLRDIVDAHMDTLHRLEPSLVRPFSLYLFQGLLTAARSMHDKNWLHMDLHAGNVMAQCVDNRIQVRMLDFGTAQHLTDGSGDRNVVGFQDDVHQITRMFLGLYIGEEFQNIRDFRDNWESQINEASKLLNLNEKKELIALISTALEVYTPRDEQRLVEKVQHSLRQDNMDEVLSKVMQLIFTKEEYHDLHPSKDCDVTDSGVEDTSDSELFVGSGSPVHIRKCLQSLAIG